MMPTATPIDQAKSVDRRAYVTARMRERWWLTVRWYRGHSRREINHIVSQPKRPAATQSRRRHALIHVMILV